MTSRVRWEDVLDTQLHISEFLASDAGQRFGSGWFDANYKHPFDGAKSDNYESGRQARAEGAAWAREEAVVVFNAEPIWVDPDLMEVIEAACDGFRPEPLVETDLITQHGLLVLPRSLWLIPSKERMEKEGAAGLNWSVASWYVRGNQLRLSLYHDQRDPDQLDQREAGHVHPDYAPGRVHYLPTHVVNWRFGTMHPGWDSGLGHEHVQLQIQAIWRLMNQTLAMRTAQRPPKVFYKRALRAKLPNVHVTLVRLRRPAGHEPKPEGEPEAVNWTHRWIVGAHWRWQWYRDDTRTEPCGHVDADRNLCNATGGIHRQIWISPFVKGPEDLPLVVNRSRIFALVR